MRTKFVSTTAQLPDLRDRLVTTEGQLQVATQDREEAQRQVASAMAQLPDLRERLVTTEAQLGASLPHQTQAASTSADAPHAPSQAATKLDGTAAAQQRLADALQHMQEQLGKQQASSQE